MTSRKRGGKLEPDDLCSQPPLLFREVHCLPCPMVDMVLSCLDLHGMLDLSAAQRFHLGDRNSERGENSK